MSPNISWWCIFVLSIHSCHVIDDLKYKPPCMYFNDAVFDWCLCVIVVYFGEACVGFSILVGDRALRVALLKYVTYILWYGINCWCYSFDCLSLVWKMVTSVIDVDIVHTLDLGLRLLIQSYRILFWLFPFVNCSLINKVFFII